jgi:sugar O-acyltransferase (sialic acid O-acetyltransferase NeuD family)
MHDLLIAGAGGFARETASAVSALNEVTPTFRLLGLLDDDPALHGTRRAGATVLGGLSMVDEYPGASVVVCLGNPRDFAVRARVVARLGLAPHRYATIVHPSASVGLGCVLGPGTVVLAQSVLTADVTVGGHVAVMPHCVLTHDGVVEQYATLASGVRLGGGARLRQGCYVGAGALIREGVTVGAGALVGMGSVVLRDVPPGEVWAGNPAWRLLGVHASNVTAGVAAGITVEDKPA